MKMTKISTLLAASTLVMASSAMAWESADGQHSTSASVAMSSDYVWRGYSQTDSEMAISGSFDYGHASGLYAGTWASNVDFGLTGSDGNTDQAHIEVDVYAGFASEFGDSGISYDLGLLRYIYPGTDDGDWNEYYASLGYSFFSASVAYTDDVYGSDEDATYYSLGFDYDLPMDVALSLGYGYYDYDMSGIDNPTDYRIGLSTEIVGFGVDLTYTDTDSDGEDFYGENVADGRLIFTVSKSL